MTTGAAHSTVRPTQEELAALLPELLPPQGCWSEQLYLDLTDGTNHLIEYTDGFIEVLPMPTRRHQRILAYLYRAFFAFLDPLGGVVLFAPLRLRIRPRKFREPDLLLLRSANEPRDQERFWLGADLVVEVLSPEKAARDLVEKRFDYAEGGIPEYWIVDPEQETITVLRLEGGSYVEHGVFGRGQQATSTVLTGFRLDVTAVFDEGQPGAAGEQGR